MKILSDIKGQTREMYIRLIAEVLHHGGCQRSNKQKYYEVDREYPKLCKRGCQ